MNEAQYQKKLISTIKKLIPGCVVMKNDPSQVQGIPDLLILFGRTWAMLEIKMDDASPVQPNQMYYVESLGQMSYVTFINPHNEQEVLNDLQQALGSSGQARLPQSQ